MKAINLSGTIRVYMQLPGDWKNYLNFAQSDLATQQAEGFYDVAEPEYNPLLQKLGDIYFDDANSVFTFPVIDKTVEEIAAEKEKIINSIENEFDVAAIKKLLTILTRDILESETVNQEELDAMATIYPQYRVGKYYEGNPLKTDVFSFEGDLYKVIQDHRSQADWIPSSTPNLYIKYSPPDIIAEWIQPLGTEDAYPIDAKVIHNGLKWKSTVDNNVWEPGVYGWVTV